MKNYVGKFELICGRGCLYTLLAGAFLLAPAYVPPAYGDIYNCNGKWQNKPCADGEASQTIEEEARGSDSSRGFTFPGDSKPSDTPKPKSTPAAKDQQDSRKGKAEAGDSKCPQGQTFTSSRPKPELDFQYDEENRGSASGKLTVVGSVTGHGSIKLALTLTNRGRGEERQAWTKNYTLPDAGGEEEFSKTVDLPVGSTYALTAVNAGSFRGYCAAPGSGKKEKDEE